MPGTDIVQTEDKARVLTFTVNSYSRLRKALT